MVAVFNHLPLKEGAAARVVERFASSRGHMQDFPRLVSMEVLSSEGTEGADEVLMITRWQNWEAFDSWVHITTSSVHRPHWQRPGLQLR